MCKRTTCTLVNLSIHDTSSLLQGTSIPFAIRRSSPAITFIASVTLASPPNQTGTSASHAANFGSLVNARMLRNGFWLSAFVSIVKMTAISTAATRSHWQKRRTSLRAIPMRYRQGSVPIQLDSTSTFSKASLCAECPVDVGELVSVAVALFVLRNTLRF